ncbi:hypothetical protein GCM10017620_18150 [Brevundimonas intermedia]|uniref:Uncharacterized protein n=1 Tax=Brevundimonas intermedia TaxID=74315 RepID=A0ABQ5T8D0_9CAUL|nr:hypothetical protein [Brevundimonas intermedia]GLK48842.1 hypothetical protein GCM10017620_18150 [Brevundimonas intermedia]
MKLTGPIISLAVLTASATPALACSLPSDYAKFEQAYYRSVTSVYRVEAEDFTPVDSRSPDDSFSVRLKPTEAIWGQAPPKPFTLTFTPGMCNGWFFENVKQGETLNGRAYFVFLAPLAQEQPSELHIMPAGDQSAAEALVMLGRLQESGGWAPRAEDDALPSWPPAGAIDSTRPAPYWSHLVRWPAMIGLAVVLFLIGLGVGRASRPDRAKS